jgi:plasmid stabilization system protein ParE
MKVKWSLRSENDFIFILDYLQSKWSSKVALEFIDRVEKMIGLIQENPELFPASNAKKNVRKCVLRKQVSLYFRIHNEQIELITFFDSRRNPKSKKF